MTALDVVIRVLAFLGLPGVLTTLIAYVLYHRRKTRASDRQAETAADFDEETAPLRIRSSSIVTLEAELAALQKSFGEDRKIKDDTIIWVKKELESAREALTTKDQKIKELEEKVVALQVRVRELSEELGRVAQDIAGMHSADYRST